MNPKQVIILGGLGNGSVVAAAITDAYNKGHQEYKMLGYLNDREKAGDYIEEYPVLGACTDAKQYFKDDICFINTLYRIDGQGVRIKHFESLGIPDEKLATFVHYSAYVAPNVKLGAGTVIMPNASISPGAVLGKCCLVMVSAVIGHNATIGNYGHFAAHSCTGAYSKIEDGIHIGLNASVREHLTLKKGSTLAMGAVLLKDMQENEIWAGSPAKFLRLANEE
jgi:acetyltransferase EpsM